MRYEVFIAVKMLMLVFWIVRPCGLADIYQYFGEIYCLPSSVLLCNIGVYLQPTWYYNPEDQHHQLS
jgi:hypothetical protein